MAQPECIVRVIGQNKFDLSIDSVKYAMILMSTDMRDLTSVKIVTFYLQILFAMYCI